MIAAEIAVYVLYVFIGLLFVRLIISYVMMFARIWRPTGVVAAVLELAYSATDPPLRALQRMIPPLRLGRFPVDLSFLVLFIGAYVLLDVARSFIN
jgi:YggT family protein